MIALSQPSTSVVDAKNSRFDVIIWWNDPVAIREAAVIARARIEKIMNWGKKLFLEKKYISDGFIQEEILRIRFMLDHLPHPYVASIK